jgi:hypothetical protein
MASLPCVDWNAVLQIDVSRPDGSPLLPHSSKPRGPFRTATVSASGESGMPGLEAPTAAEAECKKGRSRCCTALRAARRNWDWVPYSDSGLSRRNRRYRAPISAGVPPARDARPTNCAAWIEQGVLGCSGTARQARGGEARSEGVCGRRVCACVKEAALML